MVYLLKPYLLFLLCILGCSKSSWQELSFDFDDEISVSNEIELLEPSDIFDNGFWGEYHQDNKIDIYDGAKDTKEIAKDVSDEGQTLEIQKDIIIPECITAEDCPKGVCHQVLHKCVECVVDWDCKDVGICKDYKCVTVESCNEEDVCEKGVCLLAKNICVECTDDKHCPEQNICIDFQCIPLPLKCNQETPCPPNKICDGSKGICVECVSSEDCPVGSFCKYPECKPWVCIPHMSFCQHGYQITCSEDGGEYKSTKNCDDGDPCTVGDACIGNKCVKTKPLDCDDNNPCTTDSCIPNAGCYHENFEGSCDDQNPCTVGDKCVNGVCVPSGEKLCDDANPCTQDTCSSTLGGCIYQPIDGECDDSNLCTIDDKCVDGICVGLKEIECDDNDPCTKDMCNPMTGECQYQPIIGCGPCKDDLECDDNEDCTIDICQEECIHILSTKCCQQDKDCDDNDQCTKDSCKGAPFGTCTYEVSKDPSCCKNVPFHEDFESEVSFLFDPPNDGVGWSIVENPKASSPSKAMYYGNPETMNYDNGMPNSGSAISPLILLPANSMIILSFWLYMDVEDLAELDVLSVTALVGKNKIDVWKKPKGFPMKKITPVSIDISSLSGRAINLMFTFSTKDEKLNGTEGVYIDDIKITSTCEPKFCETPKDCNILGISGYCKDNKCDFGSSYKPIFYFSGQGEQTLNMPHDIAIDAEKVFVSDRLNHRIVVFSTEGDFLFSFGKYGKNVGEFNEPRGLFVSDKKLYVVDTKNHRIQIFTSNGVFLKMFGEKGSKEGQFYEPKDIAFSPDASIIYVADTSNHRIQALNIDGLPLFSWGKYGKDEGSFRSPSCVFVSKGGDVWVCDLQNQRIQVFSEKGEFALVLKPTDNIAFYYPYSVSLTDEGMTIFVSDTYNHRIQVFDISFQGIAQIGAFGQGLGQWHYPMGMAWTSDGKLFVVDSGNNRIVVMGKE